MITKKSIPPMTEGRHKPTVAGLVEREAEAPYVKITVSYGKGWGGDLTLNPAPQRYLEIAGKERAWISQELRIPWEKIDEWSANQGKIRCVAKTGRGHQCKCYISATVYRDPRKWAKADEAGGYCHLHGG